jgi:hypothetical protein
MSEIEELEEAIEEARVAMRAARVTSAETRQDYIIAADIARAANEAATAAWKAYMKARQVLYIHLQQEK